MDGIDMIVVERMFILFSLTSAMQKKPVGESRIPTDYWAGLGFSKSMPGSAIRDGLKQNNVHRYQEPSMSTTYEVGTSI